eukprot:PhM_4_TR16819/c0_g1_i3/m.104744
MLSHGYNTHMHRSEYVRTAIFLRRHVRLLTGTSDPNLLSVVLQSRPPVVLATQYVPPRDFAQATRTSTALRLLTTRFPHMPLVLAGDINFTTNGPSMVTGLLDITPPEPNFCNSVTVRGGTKPSRVLTTQDTARMIHHMDIQTVPFGDGHRAINFVVSATNVKGLTVSQLQRPLRNLENLLSTRPSCLQPTRVCSDVLHLSQSLKSRPSQRTRRALRRFVPAAAEASPRHLVRVSLGPPGHTPFKRLLENRRGTPCAALLDGRLVTEFHEVETAFFSHFRSIWSPSPPPARDFAPCASTDILCQRQSEMARPVGASEFRAAALSLRTTSVSGDYTVKSLQRLLERSSDTELEALTSFCSRSPPPMHVMVAPTPKSPSALSPTDFRPIGCIPLVWRVLRRVMVRRIRRLLPLHTFHPANHTFLTGKTCQQVIASVQAATTTHEGAAIFQCDAVKAYDSLPTATADSILQAYGLLGPLSSISALQILYTPVVGEGLCRSIRPTVGLIQGDELSCVVFTLVSETLVRHLHYVPRSLYFASVVDDFVFVTADHSLAALATDELVSVWGHFGLRVAKFRAILPDSWSPDAVPTGYRVGRCGRVLGACVHLGSDPRDCASAPVLEEIRRRASLICAHSSTDYQRVALAQRYVLPLLTYFPSPCLNDKTTQHHISNLVRRGLPGLGGVRGIRQAFFLPVRLGGRGVISIAEVLSRRTVDVVRQASICHHHGQRLVTQAACATKRPATTDNFWGTFRASVKKLQLTVCRTSTLRCRLQFLPDLSREPLVAADASLTDTVARVGLAWGSPPHNTITVSLTGSFASSYEAEMAACVIAGMTKARVVINDNMAVVNTLAAARVAPPVGACPGLTNAALAWCVCVRWTKGHSDENSVEASLNRAADAASRLPNSPYCTSRRSLEHYPHFRLLDPAGCVTGCLKPIVEGRNRSEWLHRLSQSVSILCADTTSAAFTFYSGLPPYIADTVLALRTRALFPYSPMRQRLVCVCGAALLHDLHHIALFCSHPTHTATPRTLVRSLEPLGRGWWDVWDHTVPCPCPLSQYSCQHKFLCLSPNSRDDPQVKTRRALSIWARHMHARLTVCHPGNWSSSQRRLDTDSSDDDNNRTT